MKNHSDATFERFETAGNQQAPFIFAGIHITESDNLYHIDRDFDKSNIEQNPSGAGFSRYAYMRRDSDG